MARERLHKSAAKHHGLTGIALIERREVANGVWRKPAMQLAIRKVREVNPGSNPSSPVRDSPLPSKVNVLIRGRVG